MQPLSEATFDDCLCCRLQLRVLRRYEHKSSFGNILKTTYPSFSSYQNARTLISNRVRIALAAIAFFPRTILPNWLSPNHLQSYQHQPPAFRISLQSRTPSHNHCRFRIYVPTLCDEMTTCELEPSFS